MDGPSQPDPIEDIRHFLALIGCAHAKVGKCAPFRLREYAECWVRDKIRLAHCYRWMKGRWIVDSQLPGLDRMIRIDWAARIRAARAKPQETSGVVKRHTVEVMDKIVAPSTTTTVKALDKAMDFLREKLSEREVETTILEADATHERIAIRTLDRARAKLGVISRRTGFGRTGRCWLALPTTPTNA